MKLVLSSEFVKSLEQIFQPLFVAIQSKFVSVTDQTQEQGQEFFVFEDTQNLFPQLFLEHKKRLGTKYTLYNECPSNGINVTPEFISAQLDMDIAALNLHKAFFNELGAQEERKNLIPSDEVVEKVGKVES